MPVCWSSTTGVLDLRSNVNNVGGTVGALVGGMTELDQITVTGGSFTSTNDGSVAVVTTATLDGTTNASHAAEQRAAWRGRQRYADAEGLHR